MRNIDHGEKKGKKEKIDEKKQSTDGINGDRLQHRLHAKNMVYLFLHAYKFFETIANSFVFVINISASHQSHREEPLKSKYFALQ